MLEKNGMIILEKMILWPPFCIIIINFIDNQYLNLKLNDTLITFKVLFN